MDCSFPGDLVILIQTYCVISFLPRGHQVSRASRVASEEGLTRRRRERRILPQLSLEGPPALPVAQY